MFWTIGAVELSREGSELLVVDDQVSPAKGPLWSLPVLGGFRDGWQTRWDKTPSWSRDRRRIYFVNGEDAHHPASWKVRASSALYTPMKKDWTTKLIHSDARVPEGFRSRSHPTIKRER
jgi:hypothetical protein